MHIDLQYTRSLFGTPNSYDTQYGFVQGGLTAGATDQRSKIETFIVALTYTRILGANAVLNFASLHPPRQLSLPSFGKFAE